MHYAFLLVLHVMIEGYCIYDGGLSAEKIADPGMGHLGLNLRLKRFLS